jgi:putative protease
MKKIELLSPARNLETGKAAINCGADAVYIGASRFGARTAVGNSFSDIEKLIQYAHKYFAKVYIPVNTLLFDHEIEACLEIAKKAYNAGADALIVQDMGLIEAGLPPIPLFASTQTHNINWQKVLFLEKIGFQRVILARELTIEEIREIRQNTSVELESFIHGAICVGYSGQCYLSYALTGKSGNRGECAQPCRWDYSLKDDEGRTIIKNKHLLSLKDLNQSANIENLINAGITSFKIEGRLKDLTYIKNITGWYRQKLDLVIEKSNGNCKQASSGKTIFNFIPDPERTFNRGFTEYFIDGRNPGLASFASPKSFGKAIGTVNSISSDSLIIKSSEPIHNGDGLCYIDEHQILKGFRVNKVIGNNLYPYNMPAIKIGMLLYRNQDLQFEELLSKQPTIRKIKVDFEISDTNDGIALLARDEDNIAVKFKLNVNKVVASNSEKSLQNIKTGLSKTGNSIFKIETIELKLSNPWFFQLSVINELRRETLVRLEEKRMSLLEKPEINLCENNFPYPEQKLGYTGNVLNKFAEKFYKKHGVVDIGPGFELSKERKDKVLMLTKYCIKYELGQCPKQTGHKKGLSKQLRLVNKNVTLNLEFDCSNCVMKIS